MALNKDYEFLQENGFGVEIRNGNEGYASMYLLKDGFRVTPQVKLFFKDNRQHCGYLQDRAPKARNSTHLGVAIRKMKDVVVENYKTK
ncbi:hypothetical protein [Burkholderia cenocepacia]|uniref:hypothetical protein n=1 Tax=Burkholderia cenocepacia TaxID=95486 RepID=UPI001B9FAB2B|nr:hypothetical protein [Burkholderia cenocepacia]MBR7905816.1 hypothetical protein [Burkholderia cenocepacia]MBR8426606.1 hypothetical protein [Burkholderia cenocepacia]